MAASLRFYNTLTRSKDDFVPIDPTNVRLYVCGPTVYDYAHIGNARPIVVFDLLFRLLRHVYGTHAVTYVRNITDVDDKINARAARDYPALSHNAAIRAVTQKTEAQFHADIRALGVLMPDDVNEDGRPPNFVEPRATEHLDEMRSIIERLIERGAAYVAAEHVLFSVSATQRLPKAPKYGSLSKRSPDELLSGARVDVAPYKRDPLDFVLWKPSGPQDPAWPSPAGIATPGRPGWHIECSAMSWKHLIKAFETRLSCFDPEERDIFDIHGGGIDLVFPHHENEIAQTCCAFDIPRMANTWMHNGFLQVESEKMSKSLGNFVTINELLETEKFGGRKWHGRVLKLAMLMTHYRQPLDWTVDRLVEARKNLLDWNMLCHDVPSTDDIPDGIIGALCDDLNTPAAIAGLHSLVRAIPNRPQASAEYVKKLSMLRRALELLGLYEPRPSVELLRQDVRDRGFDQKVEALVAARMEARAAKKWRESDRIRDELAAMGIVLKDDKDGATTWEIAR